MEPSSSRSQPSSSILPDPPFDKTFQEALVLCYVHALLRPAGSFLSVWGRKFLQHDRFAYVRQARLSTNRFRGCIVAMP